MLPSLISRNPDLQRLRDEGYEISIRSGHLLMAHVPYVTSRRQVAYGTLVSTLSLDADRTIAPQDHQAHFIGDAPCRRDGSAMSQIINVVQTRSIGSDLEVNVSFSSKPRSGSYADYYEKMTTYAAIIASQAQSIDPSVTAQTGRALPSEGEEDTVFHYVDTASTRAGIGAAAAKLEGHKLAIIGLGGTGSYVLDLLAKTPAAEIHLFDGDVFEQHSAFRAPGAASIENLERRPNKVDYFAAIYSRMRKRVIPHAYRVIEQNVAELTEMGFVFLCVDKASAKRPIVDFLEQRGKSFIDVGMGIQLVDEKLLGVLRVTTSTPKKRDHVRARVGFADHDEDSEYARNIQIADLNCLNAVLAVHKWKKLCGFYHDVEHEHSTSYTIDGNLLLGEDTLECASPS